MPSPVSPTRPSGAGRAVGGAHAQPRHRATVTTAPLGGEGALAVARRRHDESRYLDGSIVARGGSVLLGTFVPSWREPSLAAQIQALDSFPEVNPAQFPTSQALQMVTDQSSRGIAGGREMTSPVPVL